MSNKIIVAAAILSAVSTSFAAFETWYGSTGATQVETGLGNDTETYGYWFSYDDSGDGGASKVEWNGVVGTGDSEDALDNVIAACNGLCGTAVLSKGTLEYNPFIGIGFNVVGETSPADKTPVAGNASAWGGLCISYSSELTPVLELGLGDAVDGTIGYANPSVTLPKSTEGTTKAFTWAEFKQPKWYNGATKIDGETAASQLVAVKFKLQGAIGSYAFHIKAIGPYDGCTEVGIKSVRQASSAKAILSGRTLGFTGVKSAATVEVLDLQGQVVAKGDASKSLSLASLDAGIYMVRVTGKSVNFVNKIVLK